MGKTWICNMRIRYITGSIWHLKINLALPAPPTLPARKNASAVRLIIITGMVDFPRLFVLIDFFLENSLSDRDFCKISCDWGSSCFYVITGMPFLRNRSKWRKPSNIKGFQPLRYAGCSFAVVPSAAMSSCRSVIASPLDWNVEAENGMPAADTG